MSDNATDDGNGSEDSEESEEEYQNGVAGFMERAIEQAETQGATGGGAEAGTGPGLGMGSAARSKAFGAIEHTVEDIAAQSITEGRLFDMSQVISDYRLEDVNVTDTTCEYCAVGCRFDVYSKNGEILGTRPNPEKAPINGISTCVKGKFVHDYATDDDRLTDLPFAYAEPSEVFAEMRRVNPLYAGMDYAAIDRGSQRWPFPEGATEGTAVLHRDRFANGQRRVRFAPESIPATPAAGGSDGTTAATDDELVLLTRNQVNEARPTKAEDEERSLQIHPADAREAGVADGESIVVENDHGALRPTARITDRVRERTVFLGANAAAPLVDGERTRVRVRADA